MRFPLVTKSVTLNDFERRTLMVIFCVISPNLAASGSNYVRWLMLDPTVSDKNLVKRIEFSAIHVYDLWRHSQRFLRTDALQRCSPCQKW